MTFTPTCGIYEIRCTTTLDRYIGSSRDIKKRWGVHRSLIRRRCHPNLHLQNAIIKHGQDAFTFSILLWCDPCSLEFYEQLLVEGLRPAYNIRQQCVNSNSGIRRTPEQCCNLSRAMMGTKRAPYDRSRQAETQRRIMRGIARRALTWRGGLISPSGETMGPIHNLTKFCRERGLHRVSIMRLFWGTRKQHLGWRVV
jgi:group I intron endonuclease